MPKAKTTLPADLPAWANEPLKFIVPPDDALRQAGQVKRPKDWRKVIKTGRKTRR
jgi:hypothetical protein